jgi:hypothetical protein
MCPSCYSDTVHVYALHCSHYYCGRCLKAVTRTGTLPADDGEGVTRWNRVGGSCGACWCSAPIYPDSVFVSVTATMRHFIKAVPPGPNAIYLDSFGQFYPWGRGHPRPAHLDGVTCALPSERAPVGDYWESKDDWMVPGERYPEYIPMAPPVVAPAVVAPAVPQQIWVDVREPYYRMIMQSWAAVLTVALVYTLACVSQFTAREYRCVRQNGQMLVSLTVPFMLGGWVLGRVIIGYVERAEPEGWQLRPPPPPPPPQEEEEEEEDDFVWWI